MLNTEVNYILEGKTPFAVDTNILVYAHDKTADGEKHEIAKKFLSNDVIPKQGFLSSQNLAEFYSIATTKLQNTLDAAGAMTILRSFASSFLIRGYSSPTVIEAARISSIYKASFWDSLIAATMLENNIFVIFTENIKDFQKIPEITCINPFHTFSKKIIREGK